MNVERLSPSPPTSLCIDGPTMAWNLTCVQSVERLLRLLRTWESMLQFMTVTGPSIKYQLKTSLQLQLLLPSLSRQWWMWNLSLAVSVTWGSLLWRSLPCTRGEIMEHNIPALILDVWKSASLPHNLRNICWPIPVRSPMGARFAWRSSPRRHMWHSTLQLCTPIQATGLRVMSVLSVENVLWPEVSWPNTWCCIQTNDHINVPSVTKLLFRNLIWLSTWTSTLETVLSPVPNAKKPLQQSSTWKITSSSTTTANLGWFALSVLPGNNQSPNPIICWNEPDWKPGRMPAS